MVLPLKKWEMDGKVHEPEHKGGLRKLPDDFAGVSRREHFGWHVTGHHASGSDNRALADGDAWTNDRTAADPNIRSDCDWLCEFQPLTPDLRLNGMRCRIDLDRWTKQHVASNRDLHYIEHHTVEVEENFAAQADVRAVIAEERRLHPGIGFGSEKLRQDPPAFLLLVFMGVIEPFAEIPAALAFPGKFRVERVVEFPGEHPVFFSSHNIHGPKGPRQTPEAQ